MQKWNRGYNSWQFILICSLIRPLVSTRVVLWFMSFFLPWMGVPVPDMWWTCCLKTIVLVLSIKRFAFIRTITMFGEWLLDTQDKGIAINYTYCSSLYSEWQSILNVPFPFLSILYSMHIYYSCDTVWLTFVN